MKRVRRLLTAGCFAFAAYFASGSLSMVTSGNTPAITAAQADEKPADKGQNPDTNKDAPPKTEGPSKLPPDDPRCNPEHPDPDCF